MRSGRAGNISAKGSDSGGQETPSPEDDALAKRLVDARLSAQLLEEFPGQLPTTLNQAYSVQAASIARWPDDVVGWKVARLPVDDRARFGQERLAGPIFRPMVRTVGRQATTAAEIFDGGFAAIEAEIILELGRDIAPDINTAAGDDLARAVSRAYCGAEIASSPMPFVIDLGAMSIISDMGINVGEIVGPEIPDFLSVPAEALTVTTSVDGEVVGEASPGTITGMPFDALRFLIEHCAVHGIELRSGTLVSTGMITGVHDVAVGSKARVDFGEYGWFDVAFEPVTPR